ncbi:hypothetical protein DPMN_149823 [Dreissena polymorpha]|uniref:Uncharacterized protein n=1 Tax=Dreissena polymorpha TaxID=45954 RepID=A0A9D4FCH6_DREPO|nr:hypothetical protein DPMN_149823 [Dreissena polymorpha]
MYEELMIRWVKEILVLYTVKNSCLLVLDSFVGHKTDTVKKALRKTKEDNLVPKDTFETSTADYDDNDEEKEVNMYEDEDVPITKLISREIEKNMYVNETGLYK